MASFLRASATMRCQWMSVAATGRRSMSSSSSGSFFSANSNLPNWKDALDECIEGVESYFDGEKPDFAIVLSSFRDSIDTADDYSASSSVIATVSETMVRKQWPSVGAVVRPLDRRRPRGFQMCAGMLDSVEGATLLPATELEKLADTNLQLAAASTRDASLPMLYLLLSADDPPQRFVQDHLRLSVSKESHVALGVADNEEGSAEHAVVEDSPLVFVGPQVFGRGTGGIALPAGDEEFVANIVRSVYGDSGWGHHPVAILSQNASHVEGFQCTDALATSLFRPGGVASLDDDGGDESDGDVEDTEFLRQFEELQKEMDMLASSAEEEVGAHPKDSDEMLDDDEDDGDDIDFKVGDNVSSELPFVFEHNYDSVPLIDDVASPSFPGAQLEADVVSTGARMTFKNAIENESPIALVPRGSTDGVGTLSVVEGISEPRPDGCFTANLRVLGRVQCFRSWNTPQSFGAMCGQVTPYEDEDASVQVNKLMADTVRCAIDAGVLEPHFDEDSALEDPETASWTLARRYVDAVDSNVSAESGASVSFHDDAMRWLSMRSLVDRLHDQRDVFIRMREMQRKDGIL